MTSRIRDTVKARLPYRIAVVFGTRPEAIKMAPVIRRLKESVLFDVQVCVTGQHREMLDQVLRLFRIVPDHDLAIMRANQDLGDVTAGVMDGVRSFIRDRHPDRLLVQGDTTTTFAAAMAAFYDRIPTGHIEAGLRTGDMAAPWPEEGNRRLTSVLADVHFAPTRHAAENLLREGVDPAAVHVTGNTVIDALLQVSQQIEDDTKIRRKLDEDFSFIDGSKRLVLVTGHRRENFGAAFENVCRALRAITMRNEDIEVIYPVHLNPNVQLPVHAILSGIPRVHLISPVDYLPFVYLMKRSHLIITDSGGVQEEAPSLGKPVLVTRDVTERPEAVEAGTVRLVGTDEARVTAEVELLLHDEGEYIRVSRASNPYGDGNAANRIIRILSKDLEC